MKTLKLRIKDKHTKLLTKLAMQVNFVWNYGNALCYTHLQRTGKFFSAYDLHHYTSGATSEHLDKALNDENYKVRETAIQHPNATSEHLDKALNDSSWSVRARAIKHPNSTKEHINKALNDSIGRVSRIAKNELERRYNTV